MSVATTKAKTRTSHDSDDQVSTTQFLEIIQGAQDRLRVLVARKAARLYNTTYSPAGYVLSGSSVTLAKPSDFFSLVRMEKLVGSKYYPVWVADGLDTSGLISGLEFREQATDWLVEPVEEAPGTYRATYITVPATLTLSPDSTIEIPRELDETLIELVCADVRRRCEEDPSQHENKAAILMAEAWPLISRRYGAHPVSGLRRLRAY